VVNHHNGAPVFDIYANTQDSDLGSVAAKIDRIVKEERANLPPGTKIVLCGQVESMNEAFDRLGLGLAFAALLVYLLMSSTIRAGLIRSSSSVRFQVHSAVLCGRSFSPRRRSMCPASWAQSCRLA
jgi:multidrug efflux pump subunit AcrB